MNAIKCRGLVPSALAAVVVAVALVRTFPRFVTAAVTVPASTAIVVAIPAERLVVGTAGTSVASSASSSSPVTAAVAVAATVTTAITAITAIPAVATAAAAAKPTSRSSRTGRRTIGRSVAVRALVADTTTASAKASASSATAAEPSSEASTVASTKPAAATASATKATAEASAASKPARTSRWPEASTARACSRALGVAPSSEASTKAARTPAGDCAAALDIDKHTAVLDLDAVRLLVGGLHVFLALVHNEGVATLPLLGRRVGRRGRVFDNSDALNGTVTAKLALEVIRRRAVGETRDEQGLEGVALDLGVLARYVCAT